MSVIVLIVLGSIAVHPRAHDGESLTGSSLTVKAQSPPHSCGGDQSKEPMMTDRITRAILGH